MKEEIGILDPTGKEKNPLTNTDYSQSYKKEAAIWSKYPTYLKADTILESINKNQVTFIISGTGSGKTVLVPKFALHYTNYNGKVVVTLPKRILAFSSADYAAHTLDVDLGTDIGYAFSGSDNSMQSTKNKLIYMTDGYLIMKFISDPTLSEFQVVIIDEAHERRVQIDLLMLFLKKLLQSGKRPDLRVIIMSATIDGKKYQSYFSEISSKIINISGNPNYEIKTHFLPEKTKSYLQQGQKIIDTLVQSQIKKDILFFITTSSEAFQVCRNIREKYTKVYCIEVYADMDKNYEIFAKSKTKFLELGNYNQKLVLATNVAESSLTIDGLKYVIDSGYELSSYFDPDCYGQVLEKRLITQAQALQRRGRVGRTEPGVCYHLLTKSQFESLEKYPEPEIMKQDLTMDMLRIIQLTQTKTLSQCTNLLNQLMDVPKKAYIDAAIVLLKMYDLIDSDGKITKIGIATTLLSTLPLNNQLFLLVSYQLYCAKEASIIVAMIEVLSGKISNLFYKKDTMCNSFCAKPASVKLIRNLIQSSGDHLTYLKIFQEYENSNDKKKWTNKYGVKSDLLEKVAKLSKKYYYKVSNIFRQQSQSQQQMSRINDTNNTNDKEKNILQALKQSHKHSIAVKNVPVFSKKKIHGVVSKDSVLNLVYTKEKLKDKNLLYDQLVNLNGSWEFTVVTIL